MIYVVSDTHIGWNEGHNPLFFSFLSELRYKRPDTLILCGDIFELWRRDISGVFLQNHDYIATLHNLHNRGTEIIFVVGNHDQHIYKLTQFKEMYDFLTITKDYNIKVNDIKFHFLHGHQLDPKCSDEMTNEALCHSDDETGKRMSDAWENLNSRPIHLRTYTLCNFPQVPITNVGVLEYVAHPGTLSTNDERRKILINKALMTKPPDEYLIFGHTHIPYVDNEKKMANCGCWCNGSSDYLIIDNVGNVKLKRY